MQIIEIRERLHDYTTIQAMYHFPKHLQHYHSRLFHFLSMRPLYRGTWRKIGPLRKKALILGFFLLFLVIF